MFLTTLIESMILEDVSGLSHIDLKLSYYSKCSTALLGLTPWPEI